MRRPASGRHVTPADDLAAAVDARCRRVGAPKGTEIDHLSMVPQLRVRARRRPRSPCDQSSLRQHRSPTRTEVLQHTPGPEHGARRACGVGAEASDVPAIVDRAGRAKSSSKRAQVLHHPVFPEKGVSDA